MNRIRELRKHEKLTMKQLGEIIGVSESTVSLYENEKRQPDLDTFLRFADFFHVSMDYLLGRTNVPTIAIPSEGDGVRKMQISEEEESIIQALRSMNSKAKEQVIWLINTLSESPTAQEGVIQKQGVS